MLNFDTLVMDKVLRVTLFDKTTGEAKFSVDQLKSASIENASEKTYITGAAGVSIAALDRNKKTTFTAQNGLVSMDMMGAQTGSGAIAATELVPVVTPAFEMITVGYSTGTTVNPTITLNHIPVGATGAEIPFIYLLQKDKTIGAKFAIGTVASATAFSLVPATKVITLPTAVGILGTDAFGIFYDYESINAIKVINNGTTFAMSGKVVVETLLRDICDNATLYYAQLIMPNASIDGNFTINFGETAVHDFKCEAMQDYCTIDRTMFTWIVPGA